MSEQTMIERMARTYLAAMGMDPDHHVNDETGPRWKMCEPGFRAALAAMREPSEAMVLAARKACRADEIVARRSEAPDVIEIEITEFTFPQEWVAAIDAALGEAMEA